MGSTRLGLFCAIPAIACAGSGCGSGESQDARSARAYLAASRRYEEAVGHGEAARTRAADDLLARVRRDCPDILARRHADAAPMGAEAAEDLMLVRGRAIEPARKRFASAVDGLRFSDPEATRGARELARAASLQAAIVPQNLCADARRSVASGARAVPPESQRKELIENAVESTSDEHATLGIVEQYESRTEHQRRESLRAEDLNGAAARAFVRDDRQLLSELGIPPH